MIRESQAEGIVLAKSPASTKAAKPLAPDKINEARKRSADGESKVAIAEDLDISRTTLYRALADS